VSAGKILNSISFRIASALALKPETWNRGRLIVTVEGILLFIASLLAVGNWWKLAQGVVHFYVPVLWSLATLVLVLIATERKAMIFMVLGGWILYSLKALILDREPRALVILVIAFLIGVIVETVSRSEAERE